MNKIFDEINEKVEEIIGLIGIIGILIITANVVCRFILKISMSWSDELLRTMFIYGYFIGAALMLYTGDLMRLELLETALEKRQKTLGKMLKIFLSLINIAFFGALSFFVFNGIIMPFISSGTHTSTSNTPAWVLPLGYGIGVLLMTLIGVKNLLTLLFSKSEKQKQ